ncbi:MAG: hypothetical protein JNK51_11725 [Blastocatellia bacterium]|nr:hypothetical protein [Chloracidobacterium sp.]MBL8185581.1 hypothetical protein [Blastocatellia bacterium]HRJ87253.1 hypothetical protein [Pyrinomonadaceae bacterium]HRK50873.1 hypothetical protein [Pyrinomonadaceae bacterium]
MIRIILAVIAGFLAWSILWVGSEQVLSAVFADWFGAHQIAFEKATFNKEPFTAETTILVFNVFRGIVVSFVSGYLAALIAGENKKSTLTLGILLLAFGLFIVSMTWSIIPLWYHVVFSAMLIPMTILGGKLKRF